MNQMLKDLSVKEPWQGPGRDPRDDKWEEQNDEDEDSGEELDNSTYSSSLEFFPVEPVCRLSGSRLQVKMRRSWIIVVHEEGTQRTWCFLDQLEQTTNYDGSLYCKDIKAVSNTCIHNWPIAIYASGA